MGFASWLRAAAALGGFVAFGLWLGWTYGTLIEKDIERFEAEVPGVAGASAGG